MTDQKQGFYSLIQVCPDRGRQEVVNVGVILVPGGGRPPLVRMSARNERVREVFGAGLNFHLLDHARRRLALELPTLEGTPAALEDYRSRQAGLLVLTAPRALVVMDAEADLEELFADLVSDPVGVKPERAKKPDLSTHLAALEASNVPSLRRHVDVLIPTFGTKLHADFSWDNGARNYVEAVAIPLKQPADGLMKKGAIGQLIAGARSLDGREQKLTVVGSCADDDNRKLVRGFFKEFRTEYVDESELEQYFEQVRTHAH